MKYVAALRCGGPEAAGHMGLAISLAQTISVIFAPGVMALMARVGQLKGETRLAEVPNLLDRAFSALGLLLVPSVVFLWVGTRSIFDVWLGAELPAPVIASLASTTRLLLLGHAVYIAGLPLYYAMLGIGEHRAFGIGMLSVAVVNSAICWFAAGRFPHIETLALVYGVSMLALVACVTVPVGLRRFPLSVPRLLRRSLLLPLLVSLPGAAAVIVRPRFGKPLADLVTDALLFSALCVPGLELARRRLGVPLRLRA
jgi:O-antigen/teichoic acid export membrane protein